MKIAFVHFGREHLGLEYLSSTLKANGHQAELVCDPGIFSREDNVFYIPFLEKILSKKNIVEEISRLKPDLVGFSPYTTTFPWACQIAKEIKDSLNISIVFGGIHTSLLPAEVLRNDFVDFVIVGEGEQALLELVSNLKNKASWRIIKNLWFKQKDKIISNELRPPLSNLDDLPFPDKDMFKKYVRFQDDYMIMASRGCLFDCSYCCEGYLDKIYQGAYFRKRSTSNVIAELKIMKSRYNFREVMFFDSILFTDKAWLKDFCALYQKEIRVPFRCTGHIKLFDEETGKLLKDAGCYCIDFGVQTFNQQIRSNILNRRETNAEIKKALAACDSLKLRYDINLMFGLPGVQLDDYFLAIDFMKEAKSLNRLKCYYLSYFPKTPIVTKAQELNLLSKEDVNAINQGKIGDWFHIDSIKDSEHKRWSNIFTKIYKIYPLLPAYIKNKVIQRKLYKSIRFIPNFIIVLLQLFIGLKNKDYRFKIYINNYASLLKR